MSRNFKQWDDLVEDVGVVVTYEDEQVPVIVRIKDTQTGQISQHEDYVLAEPGKPAELFIWEEGNYACDCNRELFHRRALDEDFDEEAVRCNTGPNRFLVQIVTKHGGLVLLKEFEDAS